MPSLNGNETIDFIIVAASILGWALVFRTIWAAREGIIWLIKAVLMGAFGFIAAQAVLTTMHREHREIMIGSYAGMGIAVACTPKRSRYVQASVRRKVLARDLKGVRYDSRKHHIDHIWPHARGGSNTSDNLRVISKKDNLKKGARKPGLRDWL